MSFLFSKPKVPEVKVISRPKLPAQTSTPPPVRQEEFQNIAEKEKQKARKGRERRKTLLTGPRGILSAPSVLKRKLGE